MPSGGWWWMGVGLFVNSFSFLFFLSSLFSSLLFIILLPSFFSASSFFFLPLSSPVSSFFSSLHFNFLFHSPSLLLSSLPYIPSSSFPRLFFFFPSLHFLFLFHSHSSLSPLFCITFSSLPPASSSFSPPQHSISFFLPRLPPQSPLLLAPSFSFPPVFSVFLYTPTYFTPLKFVERGWIKC